MPPKPQQAQQEVIQPLKVSTVCLALSMKEDKLNLYLQSFENLIKPHAEYIEFISKQRMKAYALEKGLLFDPDALNDKQKKDPKFMASIQSAPTEMNSEIYFKCYSSIIADTLAIKNDPKLIQQKQTQKKEVKKDVKGQLEEDHPLGIYDIIFVVVNFPQNQEELNLLQTNLSLLGSLIIYTEQVLEQKENEDFMATFEQTKSILEKDLEIDIQKDFLIRQENLQEQKTSQSTAQKLANTIESLKHLRATSEPSSEFRNLVVLDSKLYLYSDQSDKEIIFKLAEKQLHTIIDFYKSIPIYQSFKTDYIIKKIPLQKDEEEIILKQYLKQLENIDEKSFNVSIYLESLLDEVVGDSKVESKEVPYSIEDLFTEFDDLIIKQKIQKDKHNIAIHHHYDHNSLICHNKRFHNGQTIIQRVNNLYDHMVFPGIKRHLMNPPTDENKRKSKFQMISQLIKQPLIHFNHYRHLNQFQKMLYEFQPKRNWKLTQRIYTEQLKEQSLLQALQKTQLSDMHSIIHYDAEYDLLYIAFLYKNPSGRILRRQWRYKDRLVPDLQNYYTKKFMDTNWFWDEDFHKLGGLKERAKFLFPNDGNVIWQKAVKIGEQHFNQCGCISESFQMGVSQDNHAANFWFYMNEHLGRLVVEKKLSFLKSDNDTYKNDQGISELNKNDIVGNDKINQIYKNEVTCTLTLENGLVLKFLNNGHVMQSVEKSQKLMKRNFSDIVSPYDSNEQMGNIEAYRIITREGNVIKTMKDGKKIVFLNNGNIITKQQQLIMTINNQGTGYKKNGTKLEPIPSLITKEYFDIESQSKVIVREDHTISITYPDQSIMIIFPDKTQILKQQDRISITHPDFATIKIRVDKTKERLGTIIGVGSAFASIGKDDIMMRTFDGRVIETLLPNGTRIVSYREKRETQVYQQYLTTQVNLFYFSDSSIIKVDNQDIAIIGGHSIKSFQNPEETYLQIFTIPSERKQGVYSGELENNRLWTKDSEGNVFEMFTNGSVKSRIAISFDMSKNQQTPLYSEEEYVDPVNQYLPLSQETIEPILYVIHNDNTAVQILSENQLENYFRLKNQDKDTQIITKDDSQDVHHIQIMSKIYQKEQNKFTSLVPKIIDTITKTNVQKQSPDSFQIIYRNLQKFPVFDEKKMKLINQDLETIEKRNNDILQKRNQNFIEKSEASIQQLEEIIQMRIYAQKQ